jgi:FkbM family methyltransferase
LSIKQRVLGTGIGGALIAARSRIDILRAVFSSPEQLGALANDQLATRLVTRICEPGRVFVDVGAHIGSVMAEARRHTFCKIVAVEAVAEKASALRHKFPEASVHACAAGEMEGEASFFIDHTASGYSSLSSHRKNTERITVPVRRLDSLVVENDVGVIKIDVEGAELGVLRGAEMLVARCRPILMFESGPEERMYSKADLWRWFSERAYAVLVPDRVAHNGPGLTLEGFEESHWYPRRATNYFAVPVERIDDIRQRARRILCITAGQTTP